MVSLQEFRDALKVVSDYFEETCPLKLSLDDPELWNPNRDLSGACIAYQDGMNSLCNPGEAICGFVYEALELVDEKLREESEDKKN